jgi:hypothetical protein
LEDNSDEPVEADVEPRSAALDLRKGFDDDAAASLSTDAIGIVPPIPKML